MCTHLSKEDIWVALAHGLNLRFGIHSDPREGVAEALDRIMEVAGTPRCGCGHNPVQMSFVAESKAFRG